MLSELRVKNFALIKDLRVTFNSGLNVITGETGAGKSLILKSLHLLMGGKAPSDITGKFAHESLVEGLFSISNRKDLQEKLKDLSYWTDEDSLLVRRVICKKGRSKTFINGSLATVADLRNLISPLIELTTKSEPLVELTSQHDNKNLQNPAYQRDLFDIYAKNLDLRSQISDLYGQVRQAEKRFDEMEQNESERLQKIDFLNFQLQELDEFSPQEGEYESLKIEKKQRYKNEKLKEIIFKGKKSLSHNEDSALSQIYSVSTELKKIEDLFSECTEAYELLEESSNLVEKTLEIFKHLESELSDEESLSFTELEDRLQTYEHLFRKYNTTAEDLNDIYKNLSQQREELESIDETRAKIQTEIKSLKDQLKPLLTKLSHSRNFHKNLFENDVNQSLQELNMKNLQLKVKLDSVDLSEFGAEQISFWLSFAKDSSQERSIKKAASGGELSRILLAVKGALENQEAPRTYLFDEIDAGVSGPTAEKVGKKLKHLAQGQQVITITHLPQVAALGDHHFLIEKSSGKNGEQTKLKQLKGSERVAEIARLISGEEITSSSLSHATELIDLV